MTNCDQYLDLLLYVEQTGDEISKAFEKGAQNNHSELPKKEKHEETKKETVVEKNDVIKEIDYEDDLSDKIDVDYENLKLQLHNIEYEISELLAKRNLNSSINDYGFYNNNINDCLCNNLYVNGNYEDKTVLETDILSDTLGSDSIISDHNVINATTQTSPSLSPSSTNLTWASECSSSPCLTSTSDSDLLDDAQSTSSTDDRDLFLSPWTSKQRWQQVLSSKSSSAPVLKRGAPKVSKHGRSQSDRHLAEIEAAEACKWLRATGFPQYAQMYEGQQFPIDIAQAGQDHPLLEEDVLHSLFRRLKTLNSCAHLHQQRTITHTDESEDEYCALSDNWTYQTDIRRWSRNCKAIQIPNVEEANKCVENKSQDKDDVFEKCTESPKERLRRAGSTKFRRRGVCFSEKDSVLDSLSRQLSDIKPCEVNHVSDSEITPRHTRRSRTKSFDKTDTWSHPPTTGRTIWERVPESVPLSPEPIVESDSSGPCMSHMSCTQLQVLRKLALLRLTAHIEKYCPSHRTGWNWDLPKFIRKIKAPIYKDKNIFGVPLTITLQKTGQVLPKSIEEALIWLQQNATDQVGIFRKPGVKSRIQALRAIVETNQELVNYNDHNHYDVADMVKQYFRELPEALLTNKFSETFILIFQNIPAFLRRESILCALLLMPDEHIQVLEALLHFLLQVAKNAQVNQMNESNLAMCFAPSLFNYSQAYKQSVGSPHPKELAENKAGHECLFYFLKNYDSLFKIPKEFISQCKSTEIKETKVVQLADLGKDRGGYKEYLNECQSNFLKETKEKSRGYVGVPSHNPKVEIYYKKVADGIPLRLWKVCAEIEAPPSEVLHRILRERHIWDPELHSARILSQIDSRTEVFQYVRRSVSPLPKEEYCVIRTWRTDLPKDACLIVETSVEHPDSINIPNTVTGVVYASRYLIEPCGSGKSRLLHLSRVDSMGRTPEWYQKNYGHIAALFVSNIQNSFCQITVGPESKV